MSRRPAGLFAPSSGTLFIPAMAPNALAWFALLSWPLVVGAVYVTRRSVSRLAQTTAWMLFLPVMFLPPNFDLPFAGLNKHRIALLSVAVSLNMFHRGELALRDRLRHFPLFALLVFAIGAWQTMRTNADPITFGVLRLPGIGTRDLVWTIYGFLVDLYLPFVIGQRVFRTERDLRDLLTVLSTCVLIYAPLCVLEMRLSPQLCQWVYGYFPHEFVQTMRGTGYRPVVFMNHGLSVSMFLFSGVVASLALRQARAKARPSARPSASVRAAVAGTLLLLGKSLASIIYSGVAVALSALVSAKARARAGFVLGALVVAYPVLRASDLVPTAEVGEFFARFSSERSASLMTRFNQEGRLLERAMRRPLYGWGGWGRSRIYRSWGEPGDSWAGASDVSITDGTWIIWLGATGVVGFAASIAMLVVPLLRCARRCTLLPPSTQVLVGATALIVGFFTLDLLPNSHYDFLPMVYAGALFAQSSAARARVRPAMARLSSSRSRIAQRTDPTAFDHT